MNTKHKIKIYIIPILLIGILTAIDQLTKYMIRSSFALYDTKPLIDGVFHLTYVQNTGAAWSILENKTAFFIILTSISLILCACFYAHIPNEKRFAPIRVCLIFLASGAIGNMIDRIRLHYVVDFFDFRLIHFPVFNVADIYVTVSIFILILLCLFYYKDEEFEKIMPGKKKKKEQNSAPDKSKTSDH